MHLLKQSTADSVIVGPVLDSTGAVYTGMVIGDFTLVKNGTSAALAASATATHDANGCYIIALTTGNTDTLGRAAIYANKATYTMAIARFSVLAAATFDAIITNAAGAANGLFIAGSNAATTADITGNITGNLSGSVGSVTGAVASVTGNVGGNVIGSTASVTGAVGSVTGNVGGNVVGSVGSVTGAVGSVVGNVGGSVAGSVASVTGAVGSVIGSVGSVAGSVGSVAGNVGGNVVGTVASVVTKTGYSLAATGLDAIPTTDPGSVATTFPQMMVQVWRRFFKGSSKNLGTGNIVTFKDDGVTAETTQSYTDDGAGTETLGAAS